MTKRLTTGLKRSDFVPVWVLVLVIGIVRFAIGIFFNNIRGPFGLAGIFICVPVLVIFLLFCVVVLVVAIRLFRRTHNLIPVGMLFAGIIIVFLVPLPPRPTTPEVELFLAHRADFEHVVELARKDKLKQASDNTLGWVPPDNYAYLSAARSMFAYQSDESGFRVEFVPYGFYYPIVYVEQSPRDPCNLSGGGTETKLDDHWYVCQVDWN